MKVTAFLHLPLIDSNTIPDPVHIECNSNSIMVTLNSKDFNGMIYPKGLSTNSSCMIEYNQVSNVTYVLPLRACNTMSADVVSYSLSLSFSRKTIRRLTQFFSAICFLFRALFLFLWQDDGIEYFNTVVVQPHRKLVTNQGKGYHIRCRYQTKEKTITNAFNVRYHTINLTSFLFYTDTFFLSLTLSI